MGANNGSLWHGARLLAGLAQRVILARKSDTRETLRMQAFWSPPPNHSQPPPNLPAVTATHLNTSLRVGYFGRQPLFRRVDIFCEFCTEILKMLGSLHKLNWIMLKMDSPAIINDMFSHVYLEIIQIIKICDRTGMVHKN